MKKYLKSIFSFETKEIEYKKTLLEFLLTIIVISIIVVLDYFIQVDWLQKLILVLLLINTLYLVLAFFGRLICISDNKEKIKTKNGKRKFKYDPVNLNITDFKLWLSNYNEPETVWIKDPFGIYHCIEISLDVKGRRGQYYNKKIYLDDVEIKIDDILSKIEEYANDDSIEILESFDKNSPNIILDELNQIKENM